MNKPVACVYQQFGIGRVSWLAEVPPDGTPLYTHPVKELNDGGEPVKNATYWKRQYNLMASQNDNLKSGLYHANEQIKYLESHTVKELTDEEIISSAEEVGFYWSEDKGIFVRHHNGSWIGLDVKMVDFARAILRKAQEK